MNKLSMWITRETLPQILIFSAIYFFFTFDYFFFNSRNIKGIIAFIQEQKREHDNCFITLFVTIVSSLVLVHHIQIIKILPAVETFIVYLQLRFLFENHGSLRKLILLFVYCLALIIAVFWNSNFLVEMCFLLFGCSLWITKKNAGYTSPEVVLILFILSVSSYLYFDPSASDLPGSIFDLLKNSNSHCAGENDEKPEVKKLFANEVLVRAGTLTGLGMSFFSCSKSIRNHYLNFSEFKYLNLQSLIKYPRGIGFKLYPSHILFYAGAVSAFSGVGVLTHDIADFSVQTLGESFDSAYKRLLQFQSSEFEWHKISKEKLMEAPKIEDYPINREALERPKDGSFLNRTEVVDLVLDKKCGMSHTHTDIAK